MHDPLEEIRKAFRYAAEQEKTDGVLVLPVSDERGRSAAARALAKPRRPLLLLPRQKQEGRQQSAGLHLRAFMPSFPLEVRDNE